MAAPATIETRRFVGFDGSIIVGDVAGNPSSPPVILMHGGGQTRHSWSGALQHLAGMGYFVINLDLRGHGDSDWSPTGDYGLEPLSADLQCVIQTLHAPPALVGASLGGLTALYAIGHAPRQIASALVMIDVVPRTNPAGAQRITDFMRKHLGGFATLEEAADAVAEYNPRRPRSSDPAGLMKNLRLQEDGRLYWHWDPQLVHGPRRDEELYFIEPLMLAAKRVKVPSALIRGVLSDVISDEGVGELQVALQNLEIYDVAEAGHMVAGDRNDVFNKTVVAFLRRHHPAAPCASQV